MSGDIRSDTENIGVEQEVATEEELPTNRCRKNTARIILALTVLGFIIYIIVDSQGDNNVKRTPTAAVEMIQISINNHADASSIENTSSRESFV